MKIIQINMTLNTGSTGRIAYQIHSFLDQRNVNNTIIFGYGDFSDEAGFSINSGWETHLHSFMSRKLCLQGRCSQVATRKAIKYLQQENPDIVHLHNIHGHYLNYPMLFDYFQKSGVEVVWTFHDCWPFTGKCAHYSNVGCDKWKTQCHDCPNLSTYPDSVYDRSAENYKLKKEKFAGLEKLHIVTNSDWLASQVQQSFFKDKDIRRIYNGVDITKFHPVISNIRERLNIANDAFTVLGISSVWKKEKGYDVFLSVAEKLKDECEFVMVGLTEQQITQIPNYIHGIKKTDSEQELVELYSACDVLLNTSEEETFGMVSVEAMACGIPVIVSDKTACPEIVVSDAVGTVVDMHDIGKITDAVRNMMNKGKGKVSIDCRNLVEDNYSTKIMVEKYYNLYTELI